MKKYIILIFIVLFCSCKQEYVENWEHLSLDLETLVLKPEKSKMPLCIHYNGSWNVEVTDGSDWLTVSPISGNGVATVHLFFSENKGLSRKAEIKVSADNGEFKILPVTNSSAIAKPSMKFVKDSCTPSKVQATLYLGVNTNLPADQFSQISYDFSGDGNEWIHDFVILERSEPAPSEDFPDAVRRYVQFTIDENTTGGERQSTLTIGLQDAVGTFYSTGILIAQSDEDPYISLPEKDLVLKQGGQRKVAVVTNLESQIDQAVVNVSYAEEEEFISELNYSDGYITYSASENNSDHDRYATITISASAVSTSMTVEQKSGKVDFSDFTITNMTEFTLWASSWTSWKDTDKIKLDTDIDLSGTSWTPRPFWGSFDGGNHVIKGLVVSAVDTASFLSRLGTGALLKNLTIGTSDKESSFALNSSNGGNAIAGVVGVVLAGASIQNVKSYASVTVSGTYSNVYVAGILGHASKRISVSGCVNYGDVTVGANAKYLYFAGIVGDFANGSNGSTVSGCRNYGTMTLTSVASTGARLGGVIGSAYGNFEFSEDENDGTIYNESKTTVDLRMGGVVGSNTTSYANLTKCINRGVVTSTTTGSTKLAKGYFGGVLGYKGSASNTMKQCENYGDVSAIAESGITELYLAGLYGYPGNTGCVITECKCDCSLSGTAITTEKTHVGMALGHGLATYLNRTGVAGTVNGVALDDDNWYKPGFLYGSLSNMSNVNISGDEDSCYFWTR